MAESLGARGLAMGAAASLCGLAHPASAGVWALEPSLSASAEYETNPLLRPDRPESGSALVANFGLPAQWDDGARHFELSPRLRLAEATGDSPIGANAYYLSSLGEVKSERADWSASFRWGDDSSAVREPASGTLLRTNVREHFIDTGAGWTEALTERTQSVLGAEWQSLDYATGEAAGLGLFNYRYGTATEQLTHQWTERVQLQLVALASRYQVPGRGYSEDSYSLQAGITGQASAIWAYKLLIGDSRLKDSSTGATTNGAVYVASLSRTGLRSNWAASLTKSIQPSGFGTLAEALEASTTLQWQATERISYSGTARWVKTTNSFESHVLANRSYTSLAAAGTVRATENWDLSSTLSWQRSTVGPTFFELPASGRGYGIVLTAQRRFGRLTLGG